MISTNDVSLFFGSRKLFENVNVKFTPGNCYGVIGANGAGKSTFLKILAGEIEPSSGQVDKDEKTRLSVLKQDHYQFQDEQVLITVMQGNQRLMEVIKEKDALYAKADFSEADGIEAARLETEFSEMDGWEAESNAASLLEGLGIATELHTKKVRELKDSEIVKVLLAQALFGKPDVLLLDEPTNHLDYQAIHWLTHFLEHFENTVIVVSHDRHFLNTVCSHMVDIDFGKVKLFVGNYDFWYQASQLATRLVQNENKKKEDKAKELEAFIRRFSANASKSRQATARRKQLEKLTLDDMPQSSRRAPYIRFDQEREAGDRLLEVAQLTKTLDGEVLFKNLTFEVQKGDKVLILSHHEHATTALMNVLMGEEEPDEGTYKWGVTTSRGYLPKDNASSFARSGLDLIDWLRQYSEDQSEQFVRGFLGRMLFSGDEVKKEAHVLSGGEKVRCMLARIMLNKPNVLLLDGPTNHLDLEAISAFNDALIEFKGTLLFSTHDHQFAQTVATRLLEITPEGVIDHQMSYDEYMERLSTAKH